ncbi:putative epimerase/dehydratase (plasmid) [Pseudosulfitobacter pseudonitzschiae]|uniref:Putative epimerase/dehydratase n=2 Tax=Rhodobacterales TaxID=204455 RepID=A0A221K7R7_9RHOB|nr:putative epimerase/dehydratase [Pseudosulfitobacter pseudonitzschiae]
MVQETSLGGGDFFTKTYDLVGCLEDAEDMIHVLITGAGGFLGQRLVSSLLAQGRLGGQAIGRITLADRRLPELPNAKGVEIVGREGDLSDRAYLAALVADGFDALFHFASLLTIEAEQNSGLAWDVSVESLRYLIETAEGAPKVIYASSIAIFGGALPEEVGDDVVPLPQTTYGTQKAICELLIADHSRLGRIDGCCLRLPIVVTRPGAPAAAISDRVAGILREPLTGHDLAAPLAPETPVPIVSAGAAISAFLTLVDLPAEALPPKRAFNLPALTVTVAEMVAAGVRKGAKGAVTYAPDTQVQRIVDGWPRRFTSVAAARLGIGPDTDIEAVIDDFQSQKESHNG